MLNTLPSLLLSSTTVLHLLERKLTFKPTWDDHGGLIGIEHQRHQFGEEFGLQLDGIFVPNASKSVVIFTHGNRHNITKFRDHYRLFSDIGQSFFTFDYPGYGRSPGVPSEQLVYASARAAYAFVTTTLGFSSDCVVVYGCSMGGAVAVDLALHAEVSALITESTFTNSWAMAKHLYPYLPIWPLLPKRFRNDEKIALIKKPILLIHGRSDTVVPPSMVHELHRATGGRAELALIEGANHLNSLTTGGTKLQETIKRFIATATTL